jgi:hypothetical protein
MDNLLECKGRMFTATISANACSGKIQVENNMVYLCQDFADGVECMDRLGYNFSWYVGQGTEENLNRNNVMNFVLTDIKTLEYLIFPSEEKTIVVVSDPDYGGAHRYSMTNSTGFNNGKAEYVTSAQTIQFVQKNEDGTMIPGIQSEQLAYVLLDRCKKLNNRFPSTHNEKMIAGLNIFLDACKERVQERIDRGVMGQLKK